MIEESMHRRLQEYCNCYLETDLGQELARISREGVGGDSTGEPQEVALKFIALAILYGVSERARKVKLVKKDSGKTAFTMTAEKVDRLPQPAAELCDCIFDIMQAVMHLEDATGGGILALGLRNDSIELGIALESKKGKRSLKIRFPGMA